MFDGLKENIQNTDYYTDYDNIVNDLNNYRNNIQPMSLEEANNFRHLACSAAMAQKYNPITVNLLGLLKEGDDIFNRHQSLSDSLGDMKNNLYGSLVGVKNKDMPSKTLYDLIYQDYVKNKN